MDEPSTDKDRPLVSIVTVVFNGVDVIEKTVMSIINQKYSDIQYIIIDGNSTDKTVDLIKKYDKSIAFWISEPDKGLYDAMNKSLQYATGDYVWFVNAGDEIYSSDTLKTVIENMPGDSDFIYGQTMIISRERIEKGLRRHKVPESISWKSFCMGMLVCHQSMIIKRRLVESFNLGYKYCADFDWAIRALKKSSRIHNTGIILSKFLEGGRTSRTLLPGLMERFKIMTIHYGYCLTIGRHMLIFLRLLKYIAKWLFIKATGKRGMSCLT